MEKAVPIIILDRIMMQAGNRLGAGWYFLWTAYKVLGFSTNVLRCAYNPSNTANVWFFTQGINLVGGTQYTIAYKYGNNSTTYVEKLKVAYRTSTSVGGMTNVLADYPSIVDKMAHT